MVAVLCLLLALAASPKAQGILPADRALTQAAIDTWGRAEGLPQLSVGAMAQTPDGYLWIGTQAGLVRFDGQAFDTHDATRGDLPNNSVSALHVSTDGTLWIGTSRGLALYRSGAFWTPTGALANKYVFSIAEDDTGTIWAGTRSGTIALFDGTQFQAADLPDSLTGTPISALAFREGTLWIGTKDKGLWRLTEGRLTRAGPSLAAAHVTSLLPTPGGLWIGTLENGLAHYASGRIRQLDAFTDIRIRTLHRDTTGTLWIGTEQGGLVRYVNERLSTLTDQQGLPHPTVRSLLTDREGSLWIGMEGAGLARLRPGKFVTWGVPEGLGSDIVFSVVESEDGSMWFGTEGGGISHLKNGVVRSVENLPGDVVLALAPARGGGVWAGFDGAGLALIQNGRVLTFDESNGLPARSVFGLHTDPDGTLWAATSGGLVRLHKGELTTFTEEDGLSSNIVTAITRDARGRLLIGTYERGLNLVEVSGTGGIRSVQMVGVEQGLGNEAVISLHVSKMGTTWVGTHDGGLSRITPSGDVHTLLARDGLPSNTILQALEDGRGNLWLSTDRGLSVLKLSAVEAHVAGSTRLPVDTYAEAAGLRTREFSGGVQPAGWRARDGSLWFASASGAVAVRPGEIPINTVAPPVYIQEVRSDGEPVALISEVTLAPGTRRLAIDYTALSFIESQNLRFRYRMSGVDPDWIEAGNFREADYTNLKPGHYTFEVQAANVDGVWSAAPATLEFELTPFFTQTLTFKTLLALGILGVLILGYLYRVRVLMTRHRQLAQVVEERTHALREEKERAENEKTRAEAAWNRAEAAWARAEGSKAIIEAQTNELVTANDALREVNSQLAETSDVKSHLMRVVAHDLNNPLGVILGYTDVLREVTDPDSEAPELIQIIERAAGEMLSLVQRFLGADAIDAGHLALNMRPLDMGAMATASTGRFQPVAARKDQTLTVETIEDAMVEADQDWIKEVLDNLISNAVKYTPPGRRIWVNVVHTEESRIQVHIRDEGPGLTDEDKNKLFGRFQRLSAQPTGNESSTGLGLSIVKKIVEMHGGHVWAESVLGEGTTFIAEFDALAEAPSETVQVDADASSMVEA